MRILFLFTASLAFAGYRDLLATAGGQSVYFSTFTGAVTESRFLLQTGSIQVTPQGSVVDVDDTGLITAFSAYRTGKLCGNPGSTCSLAPPCSGSFGVSLPGVPNPALAGGLQRSTFVRLDGAGKMAWITQGPTCSSLIGGSPLAPGLYDTATAARIALPQIPLTLANSLIGRRMIISGKGALTLTGEGKLAWFTTQSVVEAVAHPGMARDALTDAAGCRIVYRQVDLGRMRWLDCTAPGVADDLGFDGTQAAFSTDGRMLAFVDFAGELSVYDRSVRRVTKGLIPRDGTIESLAIGGPRTLFVSVSSQGLLRIDLYTGEVETLLEPLPRLHGLRATPAPLFYQCPLPCIGPLEPIYTLTGGMRIVVDADPPLDANWTLTGYPAQPPQVSFNNRTQQTLQWTNTRFPGIVLSLRFTPQFDAMACLGAVHLDTGEPVDVTRPARIGETIRVWTTGLSKQSQADIGQPNPDEPVLNPPALAEPDSAELLAFRLTPGEIGLQHADLRIAKPFAGPLLFAGQYVLNGCAAPVVAAEP